MVEGILREGELADFDDRAIYFEIEVKSEIKSEDVG
jgi:hypothetical protein